MTTVRPPKGMRDGLPADVRTRRAIADIIRREVVSRGFSEIETPVVENIANLKSKQGGENESLVFEILRRGLDHDAPLTPAQAVDLGLRYDLTLPLSRYFANNAASLPSVFRAFQTGPVFRAERPQKGRFRQFQQCDIDILGAEGAAPEIEVLACGWAVLRALGIAGECQILLNDRRLLEWLLAHAGIAEEARGAVLIALDKRDKIGLEGVREECASLPGVDAAAIDRLLEAIDELSHASSAGMLEAMAPRELFGEDVPFFNLPTIGEVLHSLFSDVRIVFDPTLVRGMGYYTGTIFEVKHTSTTSSICGGGRYDHMIGRLSGRDIPAVGFSFGFERLIETVKTAGVGSGRAVALAYRSEEEYLAALALREKLLGEAERVGLSRLPKKPKRAYFDSLVAEGFDAVIMPEALASEPSEALASAKSLA